MEIAIRRIIKPFSLEDPPGQRILAPLFLVSFACLYTEILLIRWIGTEVRVFAYFQNLALIACFLGFGIGCYQSKKNKSTIFDPIALGLLIIGVELPFKFWKSILESISWGLGFSHDASIWTRNVSEADVSLPLFFFSAIVITAFLILIIATMIPSGQWVGAYLDSARDPVMAYSINLLGSVAGIWLFAAMGFLRFPPELWFGLAFLMFLLVRNRARAIRLTSVLFLLGSLLLLHTVRSSSKEIYWSPYQKLEVLDFKNHEYEIHVNNTGYMTIANLTPEFLDQHPDLARRYEDNSYDTPLRFAKRMDRVLIVGSGAGNDVAAALRNGALDVDAVEIDPVIYSIGKRLHPEHPYDSPKVHVIVNDARAYLRRSAQRYDVIVFALLDSHTQISGYSNTRIDNYVYTEESFREAQQLLTPTGILIIKFEVRPSWSWMGQRFYALLSHL
ncbi:MAG TPA: hypothetical protein VEJ39_05325, partial [Candidatus Acidoferrales bacterium]|nr:hypothetical protein [Candidatus Acidoferrales bacterium]